jgi:hypothetical protein
VEDFANEDGVVLDLESNIKPIDHELTFRGNSDDCFRMGMAMYRKSMKLFTEFYSSGKSSPSLQAQSAPYYIHQCAFCQSFSFLFLFFFPHCFFALDFPSLCIPMCGLCTSTDIIIASPLGLHLVMAPKDESHKIAGASDFLSSIELVVVDSADVMYMQNFEHVTNLFASLNRIPQKPRDTDYSKIRPYYLEGW